MAETCPSCTQPVPPDAETCWSCGAALEATPARGRKKKSRKAKGGGRKAKGGSGSRLVLLVKLLVLAAVVLAAGAAAGAYGVYGTVDPCQVLSRELERRGVAAAGFLVAPDASPDGLRCVQDFVTILPGVVLQDEDAPSAQWRAVAGTASSGARLAILTVASVPGEGDGGELSVQCEGGDVSLSINWGVPLGSGGNVAWRVAGGSFIEPWPTNEAGTATVYPGDARDLIRQLTASPELIAAVTAGARSRSATFRPTGLSLELLALREVCGR